MGVDSLSSLNILEVRRANFAHYRFLETMTKMLSVPVDPSSIVAREEVRLLRLFRQTDMSSQDPVQPGGGRTRWADGNEIRKTLSVVVGHTGIPGYVGTLSDWKIESRISV